VALQFTLSRNEYHWQYHLGLLAFVMLYIHIYIAFVMASSRVSPLQRSGVSGWPKKRTIFCIRVSTRSPGSLIRALQRLPSLPICKVMSGQSGPVFCQLRISTPEMFDKWLLCCLFAPDAQLTKGIYGIEQKRECEERERECHRVTVTCHSKSHK
jgi:hypothetical protein